MQDSLINSPLAGKKILFFSPVFFGYEEKIKKKIMELGASVDAFDVRSVSSAFERALLKVNPNFFNRRTEAYYANIYSLIKKTNYDYVLIVKCDMPTERILDIYKRRFKNAKFCLHMWDSLENIPNIEKKFKYFDFVSSFDRRDCVKHPWIYFRPLYYCDEYIKKETKRQKNYDYDLCFIGTIHSDRWKVLKELKRQAEEQGFRVFFYPYLQSKFIYLFYKLTKSEFRSTDITEFRFDKISGKQTAEKVERSKIIIDIHHPKQTGLTIRTIEMIGMNKKLITTNEDIKNYDFFNAANIQVIDREKPELNEIFNTDYVPLNPGIYKRYSLESWIYEVLGIKGTYVD